MEKVNLAETDGVLEIALPEAHVLLFEPASTLDTGDVRNERTIDAPERL